LVDHTLPSSSWKTAARIGLASGVANSPAALAKPEGPEEKLSKI